MNLCRPGFSLSKTNILKSPRKTVVLTKLGVHATFLFWGGGSYAIFSAMIQIHLFSEVWQWDSYAIKPLIFWHILGIFWDGGGLGLSALFHRNRLQELTLCVKDCALSDIQGKHAFYWPAHSQSSTDCKTSTSFESPAFLFDTLIRRNTRADTPQERESNPHMGGNVHALGWTHRLECCEWTESCELCALHLSPKNRLDVMRPKDTRLPCFE